MSKLVDENGRPLKAGAGSDPFKPGTPAESLEQYLTGSTGTSNFAAAVARLRRPAATLAADPFSHHPFVFTPVSTIEAAASKAPVRVFMETKETVQARAEQARARGTTFVPRRGRRRAAVRRHIEGPIEARIMQWGIEPVFDHPVAELLANPNAHQDQSAFFSAIYQNAVIDGAVYVRLAGEDESSIITGDQISEMYVIRKQAIRPILEFGDKGRLVGYKYQPSNYYPRARERWISCSLNEIVPIRFPHPADQLDGWSRVVASLAAVEHDFALWAYLRRLVERRAVGSGVINMTGAAPSPEEVAEIRAKFEEINSSTEGGVNFVWGGEYAPSGFTPTDVGAIEQQRANRDLILAPMGVPPSALGMSEFQNYATKLAQLKFFWDVSVLPILDKTMAAFDRSMLMFAEEDTIFLDVDLSQIEALRAGLSDQIDMATKLLAPGWHMDPVTAAKVVHLDLPRYTGDDVAIVPTSFLPAETVLSDLAPDPQAPGVDPGTDPNADPESDPFAPVDGEEETDPVAPAASIPPGSGRVVIAASKRERAARAQRRLQKERDPIESKIRRAYRGWIDTVATATMKRFDAAAKKASLSGVVMLGARRARSQSAAIELSLWLPDVKGTSATAAKSVHDSLAAGMEAVYSATLEEIGIPTFEIDDSRFIDFWHKYERDYGAKTATGLIKRLEAQHRASAQAGETIAQFRDRLLGVFEGATRSAKALQVARTTAGSFMNGERQEMFGAAGIEKLLFTTAEDEVVRFDHSLFAESGEHPPGYNYQELAVKTPGGVLEYPGDTRAPYGQISSCRCALVVA